MLDEEPRWKTLSVIRGDACDHRDCTSDFKFSSKQIWIAETAAKTCFRLERGNCLSHFDEEHFAPEGERESFYSGDETLFVKIYHPVGTVT